MSFFRHIAFHLALVYSMSVFLSIGSLSLAQDQAELNQQQYSIENKFRNWESNHATWRFQEHQPTRYQIKKDQEAKHEAFIKRAEISLRYILKEQPVENKKDRKLFKEMCYAYFERFSKKDFCHQHTQALYQRFLKVMPTNEYKAQQLEELTTQIEVKHFELLATAQDLKAAGIEESTDKLPLLYVELNYNGYLVDRNQINLSISRIGQQIILDKRISKKKNEALNQAIQVHSYSTSMSTYLIPVDHIDHYLLDIKAAPYHFSDQAETDHNPFTLFKWYYNNRLYLLYYPRFGKSQPLDSSHQLNMYNWPEKADDDSKIQHHQQFEIQPGVINEIEMPQVFHGQDCHLLINSKYGSMFTFIDTQASQSSKLHHFTTDRTVYRPGDRIQFKWIRRQFKDKQIKLPELREVTVQLVSPENQVLQSKKLKLSKHGSIAGHFDLSPDATPDWHEIRIETGDPADETNILGSNGIFDQDNNDPPFLGETYSVRVEAYRKSPLILNIETLKPKDNNLRFKVTGKYRSGGKAQQLRIIWRLQTRDTFVLSIPEDEIPFIPSAPVRGPRSWFAQSIDHSTYSSSDHYGDTLYEDSSHSEDRQEVILEIPHKALEKLTAAERENLRLEIIGQDNLGQLTSQFHHLSLASSVSLFARTDAHHYALNEQLTAHLQLLDHAGKALKDKTVTLSFSRLVDMDQEMVRNNYGMRLKQQIQQEWQRVTHVQLKSDEDGRIIHRQSVASFGLGVIRMTLSYKDNSGKVSKIHRYFFTAPAKEGSFDGDPYFYRHHLSQQTDGKGRHVAIPQGNAVLIPDQPMYNAGDQVKIILAGIAKPQQAIVHVMGIQSSLTIPLSPTPNQYFSFTIPKNESSSTLDLQLFILDQDFKLTRFDTAIYVDDPSNDIKIDLQPDRKTYRPGDTIKVQLKTTHQNQPLPSEVELAIVDEAIFALHEEDYPDLRRRLRPSLPYYEYLLYGHGDFMSLQFGYWDNDRVPSGGGIFGGGGSSFPEYPAGSLRKEFKDTAYYKAQILTDEQGIAYIELPLPDDLTRWRITARAISGDRLVGQAKTQVFSTKPLSLQVAGARFYREQDEARLAVGISSQIDEGQQVSIRLKLEGAEINGNLAPIQSTLLHAGVSKTLYWPIKITGHHELKITVDAITQDNQTHDAIQITRPILSRAILWEDYGGDYLMKGDSFSTTLFQPLHAAQAVDRIEINIAGFDQNLITSALPGLIDYPYGCVEQTMSRFLPALITCRQHPDLIAQIPDEYQHLLTKKLPKVIEKSQQKLYYYQHGDGGWGWWKEDISKRYMTSYVLWGFQLSQAAGYEVPAGIQQRGYAWLEEHEQLDGFSLYVLQQANRGRLYLQVHTMKSDQPTRLFYDPNRSSIDRTTYEKQTSGEEAKPKVYLQIFKENRDIQLAWLVMAGYHELLELIPSVEELRKQKKVLKKSAWIKRNSLVMMAYLKVRPKDPEVMACMHELLRYRGAKGWVSTLDTSYAVLALGEFFKHYPHQPKPDQNYTVTINGKPHQLQSGPQFLPFPIKPGQPFEIKYHHQIENPIRLSWRLSYFNLKPEIEKKKKLTKLKMIWESYNPKMQGWSKIEKTPVLKRGQIVRLRFEDQGHTIPAEQLMLIVPLIAGIEPAMQLWPDFMADESDLYDNSWWQNSIHPRILDHEVRVPLESFFELEAVRLRFHVTRTGRFHLPSTQLFLMYDPSIRAVTQPMQIEVKP